MKTELQILKKSMAVKYCGETRFDYLDEDEIPLIINAMREFAEQQVKLCNKPAVIKSAFKCDDIELQPIECEKWRGCFDCPHYKAVL